METPTSLTMEEEHLQTMETLIIMEGLLQIMEIRMGVVAHSPTMATPMFQIIMVEHLTTTEEERLQIPEIQM